MFREMAMQSNIRLRQQLRQSRKQQNVDGTQQIVLNSHKLNKKHTVKDELLCTMTADDMDDDYEFVTVIVASNEQNDDEAIDCIIEGETIVASGDANQLEDDDTIPKISLPKHRGRKPAIDSENTLTCNICDKKLSNSGSYRYHMQLHSDRTPFLCNECGEGFKTRNAYDGHMTTHLPSNPNKCHVCGKTYRQAASLRCHMLTHTGEKVSQTHFHSKTVC